MLRNLLGCAVASVASIAAVSAACAADVYPSKVVRIVVPFAAGGSTDLLARNIAQRLTEAWKQSVVVENRPGAGSIIGTESVAKSAPDGYTILMCSVTHSYAEALYPKLSYNVLRDFTAVSGLATIPQLLSVHPSIPAKSVKELVALAKARPGELAYGTAGPGSASHLAMELFQSMSKTKLNHVPYKGSGPALVDLLGGHLSMMFDVVMTTLPHMQTGKVRPLASSAPERSKIVANIPTISESGYPGYDAIVWFGLLAPTGTPADIVRKVSEDAARVMRAPKMLETLNAQGLDIVGSSPAEFSKYLTAEVAKWRKVIGDAGIKLNP